MENNISKLVFNELRVLGYSKYINRGARLNDNDLIMAMTANENLKSLGYTLRPNDIVTIAYDDKLVSSIYNMVKEYIGDVKAKPMYPDFPKQVMEISEAEFRFHQLVHYFSTYGIEMLTGSTVDKGWLPDVEDTEKTENDKSLLDLKVIDLIVYDDLGAYCIEKLMQRRERLTNPQKEICKSFIYQYIVSKEFDLSDLNIRFKENLMDLFYIVFNADNDLISKGIKIEVLKSVCQHTGDVFKCIDYCLTRCKYHFKTSQKRMCVKLLELYPVGDFSTNVILSNKKADRIKLLIKFLDYNEYSRSIAHKKVVYDLRNNNLVSWESKAKYLLHNKDSKALEFIGTHPGTMIRMCAWLIRLNYSVEDIFKQLEPNVDKLSIQTLVTVLTYFNSSNAYVRVNGSRRSITEINSMNDLFSELLELRLTFLNTEFKGKKVYVDSGNIDMANSTIECNNKSSEGGYIRSGIAYKLPQDAEHIRFFVYWNDSKQRIDMDLHSAYKLINDDKNYYIGWNTDFKSNSIYFSGDITDNDAAEFIDAKIDSNIEKLSFNIKSYTRETFNNIDELFVGVMVVNKINENVEIYDPKNCIFHHDLNMKCNCMNYGIVNLKDRFVKFIGKETNDTYFKDYDKYESNYTMLKYVVDLLYAQDATVVNNKDEADYIITVEKAIEDNAISLIDNNFFMEA